jgi:hypothetical protein
MSDQKKTERAPATRRPYERPAVLSEEVFETMALSCAKANRFTCPGTNPNAS